MIFYKFYNISKCVYVPDNLLSSILDTCTVSEIISAANTCSVMCHLILQ